MISQFARLWVAALVLVVVFMVNASAQQYDPYGDNPRIKLDGTDYTAVTFDQLQRDIGGKLRYDPRSSFADRKVFFVARPHRFDNWHLFPPTKIDAFLASSTPAGAYSPLTDIIFLKDSARQPITVSRISRGGAYRKIEEYYRENSEVTRFAEEHNCEIWATPGAPSNCLVVYYGTITKGAVLKGKVRNAVKVEHMIFVGDARTFQGAAPTLGEIVSLATRLPGAKRIKYE